MVEFGIHEFPRKALDMKATGAALRAIRMRKKIKVGDIARHLEVTPQAVYGWEGGSMITPNHIVPLCDFLGVTMDQLIQTRMEMGKYRGFDD